MLAKTGLLVLSNPRQIGKILSSAEIQHRVKNILYIQLLGALSEPFGNFYPNLFKTWPSFGKTVSKIYSQAASDCKNLDVRILLSTLKLPTTQIHTQHPIDLVIFDRTHSAHDIDLFLKSRISNLSKDCSFVTVDTASVQQEVDVNSLREFGLLREEDGEAQKVYGHTVLGGTFDRLHVAHKMLLTEAVLRAKEKITVGVTEENMLRGKTLSELIEPYDIRAESLKSFLQDISPDLELNVVPIVDPMGPTKSDPTMDLIVVSFETKGGGNKVNEVRTANNLKPLDVLSIDLIDEPFPHPVEETKISSSTGRMRLLGTLLRPVSEHSCAKRPYVIGLTGGIASGKSKAARYMYEKLGARVIDCDKIAHELYKPGKACFNLVVQHFGNRVVGENGEINRKELGSIVFSDPAELNKLNSILWPLIAEAVSDVIQNSTEDIIVIEAAVLITAGWQSLCNEVWTTIVPREEAVKRLTERSGLTEEQAISRIESQHPPKYYVENAHVVICSLWSVEYTRSQIDKAWTLLKERIIPKQKTGGANMTLKLYFDLLSQPSRALFILLKQSKVPFEACPIALRNGQHLSEEYKQNVSRFQKVPVIENNGFTLTESVAIIRYLSREFNIPDSMYPRDSKDQARVDEYLEWQHNNTRALCALYFQKKWLMPLLSGKTPTNKELAPFLKRMSDCLDNIEKLWLADSNFIAGNTLSVADIWAACEIEQPRLAGYDPRQGRPKLSAWLDRVKDAANPSYDEAHAILNKMIAQQGKAKL